MWRIERSVHDAFMDESGEDLLEDFSSFSLMLHELLGTFRLIFSFSILAAKRRSAHFQRRSGSMSENLF